MRIGVLTSGGDAPGMNAAIRAVVRYATYHSIEVFGIERGFLGLVNGDMHLMSRRSVSDIIQRGGTKLKTARCPEFYHYETMRKAAETLNSSGIEGLIVIGGDGSLRGLKDLYDNFRIKGIGIPGTIDNDMSYTDYTLGFDTAVNTVLSAINNLRDTMSSHERVSIIEVMGRKCGDLALYAGLAGGAEIVLVPEHKVDFDEIATRLKRNAKRGKQSAIIVLAEGACSLEDAMIELKKRTDMSFRSTVLGHIQRGGAPSMADRILASRFALHAVDLLRKGEGGKVVGIRNNVVVDYDITEALSMPRLVDERLYEITSILSL